MVKNGSDIHQRALKGLSRTAISFSVDINVAEIDTISYPSDFGHFQVLLAKNDCLTLAEIVPYDKKRR